MYNKIIFNFLLTIILLIVLGLTSIFKMGQLADLSQKLYDHPYTVTVATKTIESNLISMHRYMKDVALSTNKEELQLAIDEVNKSEIIIYGEFEIIFDRYLGDKKDIQASFDAFVNWKPIRDEIIQLMYSDNKEAAALITKNKGAIHVEKINLQVNKLINYAKAKALFFNKNAIETKNSSIRLISFILLSIITITIIVLILLVKNLKKTDSEIKKHFHLIDQNIMSATLNENFKIIDLSNAFARYLSYTKKDLLNTSSYFIFDDCDKNLKNEIIRISRSGKDWKGEVKKLDSENEINWLEYNLHPVFNDKYDVISYTCIFHDISSKKRIEEISNIDSLTSLHNRRYFDDIFPKELNIAKRNKIFLAYVMLDIDHFKQYNDTYGHQDGDSALKKVAEVLKLTLHRPDDFTFRIGGEEFVMLFKVKNKEDAISIAQDCRIKIENLKIAHKNSSVSSFVTVSMGLTLIDPLLNNDLDRIYKKADDLLYEAKQSGRNKLVY
ncbi:MAG: sensor domain-containing diguanylate cyclase [Campylobacteraceae bacterium]|nr:sensor domain-containing diguanylate cyclase [Campylobacteraceae bacterium]